MLKNHHIDQCRHSLYNYLAKTSLAVIIVPFEEIDKIAKSDLFEN